MTGQQSGDRHVASGWVRAVARRRARTDGRALPRRRWRSLARDPLVVVSAALVLVNALHGLDHVRQGLGRLTSEVVVGGQALLLLAVIPLWLSFRRHNLAAFVAAVVGSWTAIAVAASHLAPHWSAFSDPYADNDLDVLSWGQMLVLIGVAAGLATVGIRAMRRQGRPRGPSGEGDPEIL